jgi:hypothetical protein
MYLTSGKMESFNAKKGAPPDNKDQHSLIAMLFASNELVSYGNIWGKI